MKKIYLILIWCILSIPVVSQVTNIKSTPNRFKLIGEHIIYDNQTKGYELVIRSDNQFEDKKAYISLGRTKEEILDSFKNLGIALQNTKTNFSVTGYSIYVLEAPGDAYIANTGKLANTAGIYYFTSPLLGGALLDLVQENNWSIVNYEIQVSIWGYSAAVDISLNDYNLTDYVSFSLTDHTSKFSKWFEAKEGDLLKPWQIAIIKNKIASGAIENDEDAKRFQFLTNNINVEEELKTVPQKPNSIHNKPSYSGECLEDGEIFIVVEKMPEFPNGTMAMYEFIKDNIQYPQKAKEEGIQGRAICQFVINKDGSICGAEIVKSSGNELLDVEAIRLIKNMPAWTPGMNKGKYVRVKYTVPIIFR